MSLTDTQRRDFASAYTRALVMSWSDEEYALRLESDPRVALGEVGIRVPEGAHIAVVRHHSDAPVADGQTSRYLDQQTDLYERGVDSGYFEFHLPDTPEVDPSELDATDLAGVAGGFDPCCCCCCC